MELHAIDTGNFKLDGGAMFGIIPKILWNKLYPSDENNLIKLALRCLLVVEKDKRILIDTGIGNKHGDKFLSLYQLNGEPSLQKSLQRAGFTFADITDVILTHLHFDHCGGNTTLLPDNTRAVPTFSNAIYWVSQAHWDWALQPNQKEKASFHKDNFLPVQERGQLAFIEENTFLEYKLKVKFFHGHTEGQVIPYIYYGEHTLVYCGDLIPTTAHVHLPNIMSYDVRPLVTLKEKNDFLKEASDKGYILFFEHDLNNECCSVESTNRGYKVLKVFKLSDAR